MNSLVTTADELECASGDPYAGAPRNVVEYGEQFVLPFCEGTVQNLLWDLVPGKVAAAISFIRCVAVSVPYNEPLTTLMLPGDRTVLVHLREAKTILGYSDAVDGTVYLTPQPEYAIDRTIGLGTVKFMSSFAAVLYRRDHPRKTDRSTLWMSMLERLLENVKVQDLTKDRQSRLQWELRLRTGG